MGQQGWLGGSRRGWRAHACSIMRCLALDAVCPNMPVHPLPHNCLLAPVCPRSVVVHECLHRLLVAERERGRVHAFDLDGTYIGE